MKYSLYSMLLSLLISCNLSAQTNKSYTVKPGEKVLAALPKEAVYMYPEFKDGIVNQKNREQGGAKLNYNKVLDEIQFISNKGDTLSLGDEQNISSVIVEKDTFYYSQGYISKITELKGVRFGSKKILELSNREKVGAMGGVSSAAITSYDKMYSAQGVKDLVSKEYLTFSEHQYFFIGDSYSHFKALNKKSLLNVYARQQAAVENYLREKSINFLKEEDVMNLIEFLKTLK
jgi:hypothetical protein